MNTRNLKLKDLFDIKYQWWTSKTFPIKEITSINFDDEMIYGETEIGRFEINFSDDNQWETIQEIYENNNNKFEKEEFIELNFEEMKEFLENNCSIKYIFDKKELEENNNDFTKTSIYWALSEFDDSQFICEKDDESEVKWFEESRDVFFLKNPFYYELKQNDSYCWIYFPIKENEENIMKNIELFNYWEENELFQIIDKENFKINLKVKTEILELIDEKKEFTIGIEVDEDDMDLWAE